MAARSRNTTPAEERFLAPGRAAATGIAISASILSHMIYLSKGLVIAAIAQSQIVLAGVRTWARGEPIISKRCIG